MSHRKCTICGKDVVLIPSAKTRAKRDKSGRTAEDYLDLFPAHTSCAIQKRSVESVELMGKNSLEQRLRLARAH